MNRQTAKNPIHQNCFLTSFWFNKNLSVFILLPGLFLLLTLFFCLSPDCNKSSLHLLICLFLTRFISYILSMFSTTHLLHASQIFILTRDSMSFVCVFAPIDPDWLIVRGFLWPFFNWSWQCTMANLWLRSIWWWWTRVRRVWLCPTMSILADTNGTLSTTRPMYVCSQFY